MAPAEAPLLVAERARVVERRGQRRRRAWIAAAAASYAVDGAFLGAFAAAGVAPFWLAGAFFAVATLLNGVVYGVTVADWNLKLRDPSLILPQNVCGILLQSAVVFFAPQMAFPWLANLLTVLAFATIWTSLSMSLALWALCAALGGVLFYGYAGPLGIPLAGPAQTTLAWLFFSAILGRFVFLSAYSASMRNRLHESRSKLATAIEQVRELASHDELTKVLNRRSIVARLEEELAGSARNGQPLCVALVDLDHFKSINDTHGHAAGDQMLQAFVRTVRATMRETDILGRYGGEEFLMILPDTALEGAPHAAGRVCSAVAAADYASIAPGIGLTVSIGVAAWKSGDDSGRLLARADAALYRAKAGGRNRVEVG